MKRLFLLLMMFVALGFVGCDVDAPENMDSSNDDKENITPNFTFDDSAELRLEVGSDGGTYVYTFTTNVGWRTACSEEWVAVDPKEGTAEDGEFKVVVAENTETAPRQATVTICYGEKFDKEVEIAIAQEGVNDGESDDGSDDGGVDRPNDAIEAMFPANTQVWYNTTESATFEFSIAKPFDANILSNEFGACANGQCYALFAIEFDAEVTMVNGSAFGNSNLEIIYLPHSLRTIGEAAFLSSKSLHSVHVGSGITTIEASAFTRCDNLSKLYIRATTPPSLGEDALLSSANVYVGATIYVPVEAVSVYRAHDDWKEYADHIVGYDFIEGKEYVEDEGDGGNGEEGDDGGDDDSGNTPDDPQPTTKGFNTRILLTKHTASWCTNCPAMSGRIKEFNATYPDWVDNYNLIECHSSDADMGTTKEDKAYSDAALVLFKFHNAAGYPEIDINFKSAYAHNNAIFMSTLTEQFSQLIHPDGADVGIAITTTGNADKVSAQAVVKAAKEKEYKITAWLLEDNIRNGYQASATKEEDYVYRHALRDIAGEYSVEDLSGESLGVIKVDESKEKEFEFSLAGKSWNHENMEVLIIVSAMNSQRRWEIVNTAICTVNSSVDFEYM